MISKFGTKYLTIAYSFSIFSEGILFPIYALYVKELGGNILETTAAIATFLISNSIFSFLSSKSKWSQRNVINLMVIGWGIWLIGIVGYIFVTNVMSLIIVQVLLGMGSAVSDPPFNAEYSMNVNKKNKVRDWGFFESMNNLIAGLAAIIGGLIVSKFGFNYLIIVMIASGTISFLMAVKYRQIKKPTLSTLPQ